MTPRNRNRWVFLCVWAASSAYLATFAFRGWIPHDEGLIAHSAERVLEGQLPHRDFDEVYTGALTFWHAAAFRFLGADLAAPRWVLLVCAILWIPAVYGLARRVGDCWIAALITLLCVAWTMPNYFAALPSWYTLFLATFGTAALLRYLDVRRRRWLLLAGVLGGLSLLVKITGAYYLAAAGFFLLFLPPEESPETLGAANRAGPVYPAFVSALLLTFLGSLLALVTQRFQAAPAMEIIHFVFPSAALALLIMQTQWRTRASTLAASFTDLARLVLPFAAGCVLPVAIFLVPYVLAGALPALYDGVLIRPLKRFESATYSLPHWHTLAYAIPYGVLLVLPLRLPAFVHTLATGLGAAGLAGLLFYGGDPQVYPVVWNSLRPLVPLAAVALTVALARRERPFRRAPGDSSAAFLLVAMAALTSLVQFPYSFAIYFCYGAPFVALALAAVVRLQAPRYRVLHFCVALFYLGFALAWVNRGFIRAIGVQYMFVEQTSRLDGRGGGLAVSPESEGLYEELVRVVQEHAAPGTYIYAAPDCPEVYFLTGMKNPTRTMYDLFDPVAGREQRILEAIERHDVRVVVLNRFPEFSPPLASPLRRALDARFPRNANLAWFRVQWRE
ncbi:MAG: glycosyltransferase family 39 protein [Planctomycetes bacterium]|nr:glycosyltransferase family 39 protein [Planctomycetota bacterium]